MNAHINPLMAEILSGFARHAREDDDAEHARRLKALMPDNPATEPSRPAGGAEITGAWPVTKDEE